MKTWNNYEIAVEQAAQQFLSFDQAEIIRAFGLDHDDAYLYLRFAGTPHRIERRSGAIAYAESDATETSWIAAGFDAVFSIFDALCYSGVPPVLSGEWALASSLHQAAMSGNLLRFERFEALFDRQYDKLARALQLLGGVPEPAGGGDLCYRLAVFDDFPVLLRFWRADEEFGAKLQFLWDRNTLQFLHFETTFYATGHLLARIETLLEDVT